jgi:RNA polymerase sigma-70 factor (ECF subfamily)
MWLAIANASALRCAASGKKLLFRVGIVRRSSPQAPPALTLESLYREHFDFVYRSAARLAGPNVDPEDVAQEVFLVVDRRLHTFDGSCQVTTWLYGITFNVARTMRKTLWRRQARDVTQVPEDSRTDPDCVELREARRIAFEILDAMPPKKRDVFILAEFEGLSCDEIAPIVGAKTETVWSRLHYARKEFSERLTRRQKRFSLAPLPLPAT